MARTPLALLLTAIVAFAAPAAAQADVSFSLHQQPDGTKLLDVDGDNENDQIIIRDNRGFLEVNGIPTPGLAPADATTSIDIASGGGEDDVTIDIEGPHYGTGTIDGGEGADRLTGGGSQDLIKGGGGADLIFGQGDGDFISGGPGNDNVHGGEGDDVFLWQPGDAGDTATGDGGFDGVLMGGSPDSAEGGHFEVVADTPAPRMTLSGGNGGGVNLTPSIESAAFSGSDGDDTFLVPSPISGLTVEAVGNRGSDTFVGGPERDVFFGGEGRDKLTSGGGPDDLEGGEGEDLLLTRDGDPTVVIGGEDFDTAVTDARTVDTVTDVELIDAPPPFADTPNAGPPAAKPPVMAVDRTAPAPRLSRVGVVRRHGRLSARTKVSCPRSEPLGCRVSVKLTAGTRTLGSRKLKLRAGQSSTASITLPRNVRTLARRGRLAARLRIVEADVLGNSAARSARVALRLPR